MTKRDDKRERESADTIPVEPATPVVTPTSRHETPHIRITVSDTMSAVTPPAPDPSPTGMPSGLHASGTIGRFTILDTLGSGGMGIVLAAYDPQLDRKVAIKVLRTHGLTGKRKEKEAARLLREARSMAQLSHPHVVTVYEAGTIDDRVFIAMEYIPGQTLRHWLEEKKRTVAEILDVYVKAGRGLAAGHHAGLIHRDFKPDNVLVGYDGRVRVIDFGLARPTRTQIDTPSTDEIEPSASSTQTNPGSQLTTAGALFGTPMYMAPEQHQKMELDARADQFAFCVSLFEALYHRMPFPAQSYPQLSDAVIGGKLKLPDPNPEIESRVADAVVRGLKPDPENRWLSMDELLDELQPRVRRNRKLVIASTVLGAVAAAGITLGVMHVMADDKKPVTDSCTDGAQRLAGVWDAAVKERVRNAFLASKRTHAPDTFKRVDEELDRYTATWVSRRQDVCFATKILHEQSESAFDLRMQCLATQLTELGALTTLFAAADASTTDNAVGATHSLPSPESCATLVLGAGPAPTAAQEAQLAPLEHEFAEVMANSAAGKYAVVLERAKPLDDKAKQVGYLPFEADVRHWLAWSYASTGQPAEAERIMREALELAARAHNDKLIAKIWTTLVSLIGHELNRYADALALEPVAEVAIHRAGAAAALEGELEYNLGTVYFSKGDYKLANQAFEAALRMSSTEQSLADVVHVAQMQNALGGSYLRSGNLFGAKKAFDTALASLESALGPQHPQVAIPLANLGALAQAFGMFGDATKYQERALKILEEIHGPDDANVGLTVYSLAVSANGREDYKAAVPLYARALKIFEKTAPDSPNVGLALVGLADCREEIGDAKQAVIDGERGLKLMAGTQDPAQLALARYALAKALWSANQDKPRARALATEARKGFASAGLMAMNGRLAVDNWFKKIDGKK